MSSLLARICLEMPHFLCSFCGVTGTRKSIRNVKHGLSTILSIALKFLEVHGVVIELNNSMMGICKDCSSLSKDRGRKSRREMIEDLLSRISGQRWPQTSKPVEPNGQVIVDQALVTKARLSLLFHTRELLSGSTVVEGVSELTAIVANFETFMRAVALFEPSWCVALSKERCLVPCHGIAECSDGHDFSSWRRAKSSLFEFNAEKGCFFSASCASCVPVSKDIAMSSPAPFIMDAPPRMPLTCQSCKTRFSTLRQGAELDFATKVKRVDASSNCPYTYLTPNGKRQRDQSKQRTIEGLRAENKRLKEALNELREELSKVCYFNFIRTCCRAHIVPIGDGFKRTSS